MTSAALLASSVHAALRGSCKAAGATVVHVTQQTRAFATQQAMLLVDVALKEEQREVQASQVSFSTTLHVFLHHWLSLFPSTSS